MNDQYEHMRRATGLDIFERRGGRGEPGGYKFVCPGRDHIQWISRSVTDGVEQTWTQHDYPAAD